MESGCGDPPFPVATHQSVVGVPMSDALRISECSPFPPQPGCCTARTEQPGPGRPGSLGGRLCGGK